MPVKYTGNRFSLFLFCHSQFDWESILINKIMDNKKEKREVKSIKEYCEIYFKNYDRNAWLKIRKKRYEEIRDKKFYLNNAEFFKNEVMKFWEGKDKVKGWSYRNSKIIKKNKEWINFQNKNGETPNSEEIIEELKNNLELQGNYSWSQLNMGVYHGDITDDMEKLKETIKYLFDENIDIVKRFDKATEIIGMGRNKISAILHIKYPDKYGVWNSCTEKTFKIFSKFDSRFDIRGVDNGEKYKKINSMLHILLNEHKFQLENKKYYGFKNLSDVDIFVWYVSNNNF